MTLEASYTKVKELNVSPLNSDTISNDIQNVFKTFTSHISELKQAEGEAEKM